MTTDPEVITAVEGERGCQFCGAKELPYLVNGLWKEYECHTSVPCRKVRGNNCYENQLAQQAEYIEVLETTLQTALSDDPAEHKPDLILVKAELLRQALEVVQVIANGELYFTRNYKGEYKFTSVRIDDEDVLTLSKAQSLILDLGKALEVVK